MNVRRSRRAAWVALAAVPAMLLAGCSGDAGSGEGAADGVVKLTLAHSYNEDQPQHRCGAALIQEEIANSNAGLEIEIYPSSQLGGDADRIASVASGDIDIDIQGASALGAVYEPISVLDAAYAFDGADHLADYMGGADAEKVVADFAAATGVQVLGAWSAGARQFTSNTAIRTPDDLDGLRVRFPGSPQFLLNAKALGAEATEVAYEEVYLALQQGTVDGQENPLTNIVAMNFAEVQDYLSLTSHQLNTNLVIMSDKINELNDAQQEALAVAVGKAVIAVTECVEEDEAAALAEWKDAGTIEIVDDVDIDAFRTQAVAYLEQNLTGESLAVFQGIRAAAE